MSRKEKIYQVIAAAFCIIVVMSNIISAKMVKLPFFEDFSIPAGLIIYPLTFLLSDLVTEIFGPAKAKLMVYIAFGMNILSFAMIEFALMLPAASFEEQNDFHNVLGASGIRIFSSLFAYFVAQMVDILLYAWIKKMTGDGMLWLRNNGSTCASQLIDTILIDIIYLYYGLGMTLEQVMPIMMFSYAFKSFVSVANTPLFYLFIYLCKYEWATFGKNEELKPIAT